MKDRLFYLRKEVLGLSRKKFGEPIGMTDSELKNIETGKTVLKKNKIMPICNAYGINRQWLETGEGDMYKSLSMQTEIEQFFKAINNTDETDAGQRFRKALIAELARIPPDKWTDIAEAADRLLKEFKA